MRVALTGAGGFLGRYLQASLREAGHETAAVSLRGLAERDEAALRTRLAPAFGADVFVNLAAAKLPANETDRWLNRDFPEQCRDLLKAAGVGCFVHVSSLNILFPELTDPYTQDKREAEARLGGQDCLIVRPGLIWSFEGEGDSARLARYFDRPLPFHLLPAPTNLYRPILVQDAARAITDEIENGALGAVNLIGETNWRMWRLAANMARKRKRRLVPLALPTGLARALAPLLGRHPVLQQFLDLDRTRIDAKTGRLRVLPFGPSPS